ncbi:MULTISPECIES: hypothetical protein [unclassified Bradyrhizobium]|nr:MULTISPECIES: hypothetical protein [unclassified Bradyrhizobium]
MTLYALALLGAVTVLVGAHRARWIVDPKSWKAGKWLLPWGPG